MPRKARRRRTLDPTKILWIGIMVLGVFTALGIGLLVVTRLRQALVGRAGGDPDDTMETFRRAFERGEMDQAEFLRIKASLGRGEPAFPAKGEGWPRGDGPTS